MGQRVSVVGVVSGDFQDKDPDESANLGGFYIQDETPDNDASTSDGVFVFDGVDPQTNVDVGNRVTVTGTVSEYFGETQISDPTVTVVGSGHVAATEVMLPAAGTMLNSDGEPIANLERFEGMLLHFPQTMSVTGLRNLERFGAVVLSLDTRLEQFTNFSAPDPAAYKAHQEKNARRSLRLDDGQRVANPATIRYLDAGTRPAVPLRAGDRTSGITGNLRYARGSGGNGDETWRLMPTVQPRFDPFNPRPPKPSLDGDIRVASFNVLNLFSTVDTGDNTCGPRKNENCRGADSETELQRQLAKIVSALLLIDADIVALIELENNSSASLQLLIDAVNARSLSGQYAFVDTGTIREDAIKTGFIYKTVAVGLVGQFAILDSSVDARFDDTRNRPALAQSFRDLESGGVFTVVVNHLKSKGSSCAAEGDPNLGDGQGNCNKARDNAAVAIADWLASDPTGSNDADYLVIGDLNAYTREDPLVTLEHAGFTNLLGASDFPYSFVYDAQAGALDHALASPSLALQVVETIEWHINADEPEVLDYNLENGRAPALFDAELPYRSSDHDPVIIGIDLKK